MAGDLQQTIAAKQETNGLPSGYNYLSPFLTFSTASLTADPGTYLVAVMHKGTNGEWELTGSNYYQNPIKITIAEPTLNPDPYEDNNTLETAYILPFGWVVLLFFRRGKLVGDL